MIVRLKAWVILHRRPRSYRFQFYDSPIKRKAITPAVAMMDIVISIL